MKRFISLSVILIITGSLIAQDTGFGIKFSGFVKNDFFYDSRQTVDAREGHFLLWPAAPKRDVNGDDINAKSSFNFLAIQTRLTGSLYGPDAFGARTSGVIEGAFFGHSNPDVNGFRLRHAYGKLSWDRTELLFGQTWHPMFISECFPDVVSFNTGAPFQPFSRNPQIRVTQSLGGVKVALTAFSQRDFTSAGGSSLLRNSAIPAVHLGGSFAKKGKTEILAGAGVSYQTLVPRLQTELNYKADEKVSSWLSEAYMKIKAPDLTFKIEAVYGQNTFDIMGISSFDVLSIDPETDHREYLSQRSMSVWSEILTNGSRFQFGLFGGYTRNLGTEQQVLRMPAGNRANIDYIYRVSPRMLVNSGKVRLSFELEHTTAAFGVLDEFSAVMDSEAVSNLRVLVGFWYFF